MIWYAWAIIIMGLVLFGYTVIFALCRGVIALRVKCWLFRKGSKVMVAEMRKDRRCHEFLQRYDDDKISFAGKTYGCADQDIMHSTIWGVPMVVLNENLTSSVSYKSGETNPTSPTALDKIIKRVKMRAQSDQIQKLITVGIILISGVLILLMAVLAFTWKMYATMDQAGIKLQF